MEGTVQQSWRDKNPGEFQTSKKRGENSTNTEKGTFPHEQRTADPVKATNQPEGKITTEGKKKKKTRDSASFS